MEVALTCQICGNNPHKYTCPRCQLQTCSLACCLEHKQKTSCSGVRDPVVYYRKNEYGTFAFQQDYHLLEEIDRRNAIREKQLFTLSRKNKRKLRGRVQLTQLAKERGIELRLCASAILTRAAVNKTHIVTGSDGQKSIVWSVEFNLLPMLTKNSYAMGTNLSRLKPLRIVLHDCEERSRLGSLWHNQVLQLDPEKQDELVTYAPAGSPPFGLITSWVCAKSGATKSVSESHYYFYVQTEQIETNKLDQDVTRHSCLTRKFFPVEVFSTNRLIHILTTTPYLIVHEMPTIWVSRVPLT